MDDNKRSAQFENRPKLLRWVGVGAGPREKLKIVLESLQAPVVRMVKTLLWACGNEGHSTQARSYRHGRSRAQTSQRRDASESNT